MLKPSIVTGGRGSAVGDPKMFTSLEHARFWYADFFHWYNTSHLHSALGYAMPHQRRSGEAEQIYATRNKTITDGVRKILYAGGQAEPIRTRVHQCPSNTGH